MPKVFRLEPHLNILLKDVLTSLVLVERKQSLGERYYYYKMIGISSNCAKFIFEMVHLLVF